MNLDRVSWILENYECSGYKLYATHPDSGNLHEIKDVEEREGKVVLVLNDNPERI